MTSDDRAKLRAAAAGATPGPWHYYPCGEKSNDCLLGVAWDEDGQQPPAGQVDLHPYNERARKFEMDKYILDPVIAGSENDANYADFAFMALANPAAVLALLDALATAEAERDRARQEAADDRAAKNLVMAAVLDALAAAPLPGDSADVQQVPWTPDHLAERFRLIAAERDALRAALAPFAAYAVMLDAAGIPDTAAVRYDPSRLADHVTAGHCRAARDALGLAGGG